MNAKRFAGLFLLVGCSIVFTSPVQADPPSLTALFRKKSNKVAASPLELTVENGPWLIFARRFEGDDALAKASELANELRTTYNLNAYVFNKTFDYSESMIGNGITQEGKPRRMKNMDNGTSEFVAVIVGDFVDSESPKYEEAMKVIKCARPKSLGFDGSNPGASYRGTWKELRETILAKKSNSEIKAGPMVMAFGTPNPMLPKDFFRQPIVDKFVKSLNSRPEVEHSLLENKGRFTVRVASFRGEDAVAIRNQANASLESLEGDALVKAEELSSVAVRLLRDQGIEAYQFHDRVSSIVTIGSFESIGQNDANGQFQYAPEIQAVMAQFGGMKEMRPTQYGSPVPVAKTVLDVLNVQKIPELTKGTEAEKKKLVRKYSIPFELSPCVMAVPKVEKKSLYGGALLGQR